MEVGPIKILNNLKNIELGPHYIKNRNNSYKKLEFFGIPLSNLISDFIWLDNFKQFSYLFFNFYQKLSKKNFRKRIKSKYFKNGSHMLVSILIKNSKIIKSRCHYNCRVISINQNKEELNIVYKYT